MLKVYSSTQNETVVIDMTTLCSVALDSYVDITRTEVYRIMFTNIVDVVNNLVPLNFKLTFLDMGEATKVYEKVAGDLKYYVDSTGV